MEYKSIETSENKPLEKSDAAIPEQEVPQSIDSTSGTSDAGRNGYDDGNVDLSRTNVSDSPSDQPDLCQVEEINGRLPINCEYAGDKYPVENLSPELQEKYPNSVEFDKKGFPDFSPYCKPDIQDVQIEYTGNRSRDFKLANNAAGLERTPEGYTWHHHQDAKTLQLVPTELHDEVRHTGGCATSGMDYNKRK